VQIAADDILEIAMERGGLQRATVVPYEASAALSMLLLRDYGMLMVHFVGVPPGGPPEWRDTHMSKSGLGFVTETQAPLRCDVT